MQNSCLLNNIIFVSALVELKFNRILAFLLEGKSDFSLVFHVIDSLNDCAVLKNELLFLKVESLSCQLLAPIIISAKYDSVIMSVKNASFYVSLLKVAIVNCLFSMFKLFQLNMGSLSTNTSVGFYINVL